MSDPYYTSDNLNRWRELGHLTERQVEARLDGFTKGETAANFHDAYGGSTATATPDRFTDLADEWQEAFAAGVESWRGDA